MVANPANQSVDGVPSAAQLPGDLVSGAAIRQGAADVPFTWRESGDGVTHVDGTLNGPHRFVALLRFFSQK